MIGKIRRYILSIIFSFVFFSCTTTASLQREAELQEQLLYLAEDDVQIQGDDRYIFIRLYNPKYKNPLYIAQLLKSCINATEVNDITASHAGIGFNLNDDFYGLSLSSNPQLKPEHCTSLEGNYFMEQCDMSKSTQITYAIKVTKKEYRLAKKILAENKNARYNIRTNFKMARRSIKRAFFTSKKNQSFDKFLPTKKDVVVINEKENAHYTKKFVCSSFLSYILFNSIESVQNFFAENHIDYHYTSVTDLAFIPGMTELFSSTWQNYNVAANEFAMSHAEFLPYISN